MSKEKARSLLEEFRAFAMRGNVIDLAVGVIIGGAFGTIVNSLVADVVMPVFGVITGGINFSGLSFELGAAKIAYGKFLQATLSFLIIAWALFMVIKAMNALKKKEEAKPAAEKEVPEDVKLLGEIRDLLKEGK
jgi:large conductance mechanosensitive channel